jgi:O-acetyl-ADP-ribose deacetylase (regulator of RNase III)
MINYIQEDIFTAKEDILIHGCNCFCKFGKGIAYYIKKYYPEAYSEDCKTIFGDKQKLGTYSYVDVTNIFTNDPLTIVNAYTQYNYGLYKDMFEYDSFSKILESVKQNFINKSICMPKIGAGLAGGDWNRIEDIINKVFLNEEVKVYYI